MRQSTWLCQIYIWLYLFSDIKINLILLQQKQQHKNNRGSDMSTHVLFNVSNNHGDQKRGFFKYLSILCNELNKLNITVARMVDYIYLFETKATLQSRLYSVPYIYALL